MGSPIQPGVLLHDAILFISLTHVFFTILLFIVEQVGKIHQSIRTLPRNPGLLLGLYVITYVISCILVVTRLEAVIRFDGVFVVIYLVSVVGNLISLWKISNWPFAKRVQRLDLDRELVRYLEEHGR